MRNHNFSKIALIQCICPHYRVPFFKKLAESVDLNLFYGEGDKQGAWRSSTNINGFKHHKLVSFKLSFQLGEHPVRLVWFPGLFWKLFRLRPQIVISEGMTNIVNNVFIWLYCKFFSTPYIIWDSGRKKEKSMGLLRKFVEPLNRFIFRQSKSLIAYSSVAKDYMISLGISSENIFVAQNTIDVDKYFIDAEQLQATPSKIEELRENLGIKNKKVILYVGGIEKRKNLEMLLVIYKKLKREITDLAIVIVGDGPYLDELKNMSTHMHLEDCLFPGRVVDGVGHYFSMCEVFVLPGRGGLSINQALCYGKPIIVGEGDGTEGDLIRPGVNGFIIKNSTELEDALRQIIAEEFNSKVVHEFSYELIKKYDLDNMVGEFVNAISFASIR